jgi:hypothetical protein
MKEMKNMESMMKSALDGYSAAPPPAVRKRIMVTVFGRGGFIVGGFWLSAFVLLFASGLTAFAGIRAYHFMTGNDKKSHQSSLPENKNSSAVSVPFASDKSPLAQSTGKNFHENTSSATEIHSSELNGEPDKSEPSDKANSQASNNGDKTVKSARPQFAPSIQKRQTSSTISKISAASSDSPSGINEDASNRKPGKQIERHHHELFGKLQILPLKTAQIHEQSKHHALKEPLDFYMPKSPRSWSKWTLQVDWNTGIIRGLVRQPQLPVAEVEYKYFSADAITAQALFHLTPRWNLRAGIGHLTSSARMRVEFQDERTTTQIVVIDGVEVEIETTDRFTVTEQETLRMSYLTVPIGLDHSIYFDERFSLDPGLGLNLAFLNYSHGIYRMSPDRKINLGPDGERGEALMRIAVLGHLRIGGTYHLGHRMCIQAGLTQLLLLNSNHISLKDNKGGLINMGFGYRF